MAKQMMYDTRGVLQEINLGGLLTAADVDTQAHTLTVAQIVGGVVVHTSTGGAANVTTDTAVNIIAGSGGVGVLREDGDTEVCYYINDGGNYDLTLVGGTDVTVADNGQKIGQNESAVLLFRRTAATTVTVYSIGGRA